MLWAALQGIAASIVGIYLSFYLNVASGASIVVVNTVCFVLCLLATSYRATWQRRQRAA